MESTFLGMLVGDAISVPLHWYYDHGALRRDRAAHLAPIPGAVDAATGLQTSIVDTPAAMRGGHPSSCKYFQKMRGEEVAALGLIHGEDAVRLWDTPGTHYHATLSAGQSTSTTAIALMLMRLLVSNKRYSRRQ
jgi:ADP-ribosyl-[dinitrogen reductase] hydrolase